MTNPPNTNNVANNDSSNDSNHKPRLMSPEHHRLCLDDGANIEVNGLNFGQRLEYLRIAAELSIEQVAMDMTDLGAPTSMVRIEEWETSLHTCGDATCLGWMSLLYQNIKTGQPANLNWLVNDIGLPYVANLTSREYKMVDRFREVSLTAQDATYNLIDTIATDVSDARETRH